MRDSVRFVQVPTLNRETKKPEFDDLMDFQGGFGRFQWFAYLTIIIGITSSNYLEG